MTKTKDEQKLKSLEMELHEMEMFRGAANITKSFIIIDIIKYKQFGTQKLYNNSIMIVEPKSKNCKKVKYFNIYSNNMILKQKIN